MLTPKQTRGRVSILLLLFALATVVIGSWLIYDRFLKSDLTRICHLVQSAVNGAKARAPSSVSAILSEDFSGPQNVTKDDVHRGAVAVLMQQYRHVDASVAPLPLPVEFDPQDPLKATAIFSARLLGRTDDNAPWDDIYTQYFDDQARRFKAYFKKTDKGWRMYQLEIIPLQAPSADSGNP